MFSEVTLRFRSSSSLMLMFCESLRLKAESMISDILSLSDKEFVYISADGNLIRGVDGFKKDHTDFFEDEKSIFCPYDRLDRSFKLSDFEKSIISDQQAFYGFCAQIIDCSEKKISNEKSKNKKIYLGILLSQTDEDRGWVMNHLQTTLLN